MFIALLTCNGSLSTNCVSLKNEPCMARSTVIDLDHAKHNYYLFLIILDKCYGR